MTNHNSYTGQAPVPLEDDPLYQDQGAGPGLRWRDALRQLTLHKWLAAKITGAFVLAGVLVALLLPNRYTAAAKIMPPQQVPSSVPALMNQLTNSGAGSFMAVAGGNFLKNPNDIYIGLLSSRPVADAIIRQFDLMKRYHSRDMTAAREKLAHNSVVVSEKSGLISISVTDKDKKLAAGIANAYPEQLRILTKTLAVTEASQRRIFYEDQLKRANENLSESEDAFQHIQQKRGLIQLDMQAREMIASMARLRAQLGAKEVELQTLRSFSTENNPQVQLAERELASLQAEMADLEKRSPSSNSASIGLEDVANGGLEYLRAQHEVIYLQAVFDMLMKQYDAAGLDEAKEAAIIQMVEPAIEPDRKSSPQRMFIVLFSTILGLISGCAFVLFRRSNAHSLDGGASSYTVGMPQNNIDSLKSEEEKEGRALTVQR